MAFKFGDYEDKKDKAVDKFTKKDKDDKDKKKGKNPFAKDDEKDEKPEGNPFAEAKPPVEQEAHADVSVPELYEIATPEERAMIEAMCERIDSQGGGSLPPL